MSPVEEVHSRIVISIEAIIAAIAQSCYPSSGTEDDVSQRDVDFRPGIDKPSFPGESRESGLKTMPHSGPRQVNPLSGKPASNGTVRNGRNVVTDGGAHIGSEDDRLMLRLQEGDARAFEELVQKHQGGLFGFFLRQTRDRQFSEDLTQETLLRVYNQSWDYLPRGIFRGWMFRIARNLLIDNIRKRSHDALVKSVRGDAGEVSLLARLPGADPSAETRADQAETMEMVLSILRTLPEEQRLTFSMHVFEGLSLPEVADAMAANLPTTKSRLRLAREKLRARLAERGITGVDDEETDAA